MEDITTLFDQIIEQSGSFDVAESEFKRMMHSDDDLKQAYRQWCRQVGSSEKNGFLDYCEELRGRQDDIWDTLSDYDDQE